MDSSCIPWVASGGHKFRASPFTLHQLTNTGERTGSGADRSSCARRPKPSLVKSQEITQYIQERISWIPIIDCRQNPRYRRRPSRSQLLREHLHNYTVRRLVTRNGLPQRRFRREADLIITARPRDRLTKRDRGIGRVTRSGPSAVDQTTVDISKIRYE